ncbi:alpha-1,2-fucosyltransferase [Agrobacterium rosae]|uniref:Alpha-1,2-fucosyltransferase n=1 Tax=Agrobacterium rosae TaxID=1972867 RepID=A0AAE5VRA9_9HYPH|nr:alpha-1,2-fucosyltransferase [Agrobacterium rosae]KAA3521148.1 alpha-1,2-fucosyltransferase [Agrobacterium rosae]MCM2433036.1 alpha-1,2-fucosyltransferase [Agrobacterium rosae]MDX8327895.1 alpha-1,2-fucosyltransferase [Agrobacterium rosae]MQB48005.1 alpha-1,2-fucosyltransferase [Agrobacterium rosae]POO53695.1 alpha-1,2-fucosyltransferase [Agrobacterium rosae]
MIITRIVGGLGNQMFQYAAGRALSLASGQPLKLDLTEMNRDRLRALQLDQFNIKGDIASLDEVPARQRNSVFGRIVTSVKNRSRVPQRVEKSAQFDPAILLIREPVHLSGYWQTEKYFADYADIIRADFSLKQPYSAERQKTLTLIAEAQSAVSVHVRRGDYVTNPTANSIHGTCEPEWYAAAMQNIASKIKDATFFVFSDDPQWARQNLATIGKMTFIEPQSDGRDGEDMHLMAACHSHIIANSTFSWWGAWLNPRADKRVIAPARWFRSQAHDNRDLVPSVWERLAI